MPVSLLRWPPPPSIPSASIPELKDFAIFAGDGHYHAAVHDKMHRDRSGTMRKEAAGWRLNQKVFNELKTKLVEKKAWGSAAVAKATQSQFPCLAHNLLVAAGASPAQDGKHRQYRNRQ